MGRLGCDKETGRLYTQLGGFTNFKEVMEANSLGQRAVEFLVVFEEEPGSDADVKQLRVVPVGSHQV